MPATLDLEIHERAAPSGWDDELLAADGVVFHSEAWAEYKVHEGGGEPLFCAWRDRGAVTGRALGMRRPARSSRTGRLAHKVVFDSPPAAAAQADFVGPLWAWARRSPGLVEVTLGSYDVVGSWGPGELPHSRPRYEFVLPPGSPESVFENLRPRLRRTVRLARKAGLTWRVGGGLQDARDFADLYGITRERLQKTKDYEPGSTLDHESFAGALDDLARRGAGRVYLAEREGRAEAGVAFATFGERAYLVHSGATDEGRDLGAPYFVLCEALADLRGDGCQAISLGGAGGDAADQASPEYGLYEFKTRMGAEPRPRTSGALVPRPLRAKAAALAKKLARG